MQFAQNTLFEILRIKREIPLLAEFVYIPLNGCCVLFIKRREISAFAFYKAVADG